MKFRLLHSQHTHTRWVEIPAEEVRTTPGAVKDAIDGVWRKLVTESFNAPAVIESDRDLAKLFGANKFERVDDNTPLQTEVPLLQRLQGRTIKELRDLAEEDMIDLGSATKKQDIIETMLNFYEQGAEV